MPILMKPFDRTIGVGRSGREILKILKADIQLTSASKKKKKKSHKVILLCGGKLCIGARSEYLNLETGAF